MIYIRRFWNWVTGAYKLDANERAGLKGRPGPIPADLWRPQKVRIIKDLSDPPRHVWSADE